MIAVVAMVMVRDLAVMAMMPAVMGDVAMPVSTAVIPCVLAMMATVVPRGRGLLVAILRLLGSVLLIAVFLVVGALSNCAVVFLVRSGMCAAELFPPLAALLTADVGATFASFARRGLAISGRLFVGHRELRYRRLVDDSWARLGGDW
jgi:hypothetical protein